MDCSFTIDFTTVAETVIENMKAKILANDGTFTGDNAAGSFTVYTPVGQVAGGYTIASQQIAFEITDKPFFLPCGQIENYVKSNLIPA